MVINHSIQDYTQCPEFSRMDPLDVKPKGVWTWFSKPCVNLTNRVKYGVRNILVITK